MPVIYKVNGVKYVATKDENGNEIFDPPLPDAVKSEWDRRKEEGFKMGFPKLRTASTFHSGRGTLLDQLGGDEVWAEHVSRQYKKKTGKSLTGNEVYIRQLAKEPGDPDAIFDASEGYEKLERSINRLGDHYNMHNKEPVRLAPDLIDEMESKYRSQGDTRPRDELRHHIVEKHGQKV